MSILSAEPSVFPDCLLSTSEPTDPIGAWWLIHTKPRQEKSLARGLHEREIPFFLPLLEKRTRIRGKMIPSYSPLFTSYVFLAAPPAAVYNPLLNRHFVRILEVKDPVRLHEDLRQIHRLLLAGLPVTPQVALVPGAAVEVRSGPLRGMRGKILRSASGSRFIVEVDFIHQGASVMVDESVLERVDERASS
jgi:transcriptional antiterminator RfaH